MALLSRLQQLLATEAWVAVSIGCADACIVSAAVVHVPVTHTVLLLLPSVFMRSVQTPTRMLVTG